MNQAYYGAAIVLGFVVAAFAFVSRADAQEQPRFGRLVTISVDADPTQGVHAHTVEITTDRPTRNRTQADVDNRIWTATRVFDFRTDVIRSDTCPQLRSIALSFAALPAMPIQPPATYVDGNEAGTINPTMSRRLFNLAHLRHMGFRQCHRRCSSDRSRPVSPMGQQSDCELSALLASVKCHFA